MANFWDVVNKVIREADILLLVMDSRLSLETRNEEVENKIIKTGKPYLFVLTKCDLIDQELSEKLKKEIKPSLFVSSTEYHGLKMLREKIIVLGKKHFPENKSYTVGILGYPNVGKSSLINAMCGRSSAGVSSVSGFTKGVQKIRSDNTILFLDTPGVVPYSEKNDEKHAMIGTTDYNKVKEPDLSVLNLMNAFPGKIESFYEIPIEMDGEEKIELIAKKRNILKKGGMPDIERMSRKILKDWQEGTIK
jgi:ribosome biogenesis GTPase A